MTSSASTIEDLSSPLTLRQLVLNYLLHYSYVETATAFATDIESSTAIGSTTPSPSTSLQSTELDLLAVRKQVRDAILSGEIEVAISLINNHFPTVLLAPPHPDVVMNGTEPSTASTSSRGAPVPTPYSSRSHHSTTHTDTLVNTPTNAPTLPDNPTSLDPAHLSLNLQIQNFIESVRRASAPGSRGRWESAASSSSTQKQQHHNKQPQRSSHHQQQQQAMSSSIHSLASNSSCASASTALSRPTSPALSSVSSSASGSLSHQPPVAAAAAGTSDSLPTTTTSGTGAQGSAAASNGVSAGGGSGTTRKQGKMAARVHPHQHKHQTSSPASSSHHHSVTTSLHLAIAHAQSLYRAVDALPSYWQALYRKELEKVTSLLAYPELEGSPVKQLLHPNRRVALAEQINSAILFRTGRPSQPLIETAARQTTYVWNQLAADRIAVPAGHPLLSQMNNNTASGASSGSNTTPSGLGGPSSSMGLMGQGSATAGLSSSLAALVQATHAASNAPGSITVLGGGGGSSSHPGLTAKSDSRRSGGSKETGKVLQPWNLSAFLNSR
ncbi:hypothetical protein CF327_g5534 [Tilletia walkeri]|nr:hypothetical protein CF327_g5534 [Tilletia walkeri]